MRPTALRPTAPQHPTAPHSTNNVASGSLRAATAMILLGGSTAVTATLTGYPINAGQALRYLVAAAILLPLSRRGGRLSPGLSTREVVRLIALAATGLFVFNLLLIQALRRSDPATVGSVVGCTPLVLAVVTPLLAGRRPRPRLVLAGAVVVVGAGVTEGYGGGTVIGFLCAVGTLACEAGFSLIAVPMLPRLGPVRVSAYTTALAVPMFALAGLLTQGTAMFVAPTARQFAALMCLAALLTCVAFLMWYSAVLRIGPERAGLFAGIVPLAAALSAAAVGTGTLRIGELFGALLVGAGVCIGIAAGSGGGSGSGAPTGIDAQDATGAGAFDGDVGNGNGVSVDAGVAAATRSAAGAACVTVSAAGVPGVTAACDAVP